MPLAAKAQATEASDLIAELKEHGLTKYKIAQELRVSWRTVHNWSKAFFDPKPEKLRELRRMAAERAGGE